MLSGYLLPAHPHPLPDELFTSWVTRLAQWNVEKVYSLGINIWGQKFGREIWNRDIDCSMSESGLLTLCNRTGATLEEAQQSTLSSYEGVLFETMNRKGLNRWILPAGIYHRTRSRNWIVYCPRCLAEDADPYFRKSWRLSFNTVCECHGTQMLDACPACNQPIVFFRQELGHKSKYNIASLTLCFNCGFDLREANTQSPLIPDAQTLAKLMAVIKYHESGWWFIGSTSQTLHYGLAFFDVFHYLCTFLTSKEGGRILQLAEYDANFKHYSHEKFIRMPFETRPLVDRHRLVMMTLWLLENWPQRFIQNCLQLGITASRITRSEQLAYWFMKEVDFYLTGQDALSRVKNK